MEPERLRLPPLYPIVAASELDRLQSIAGVLAGSSVAWIQVREKALDDRGLHAALIDAIRVVGAAGHVFVNDRPDLALLTGAYGLHLGQDDLHPREVRKLPGGERLVIGYSTHHLEDALRAADDPAVDYVAIGPIYQSGTKQVREPLGLEIIRSIRRFSQRPLVAIGGIDASNIAGVLEAGADSAAVIGALKRGGGIEQALRTLLSAISSTRQ